MWWHTVTHGGKWRGNCQMEWVASISHTTSEGGVSSITTADAHTSAASSQLNWSPRRFKWDGPFRRKTKYGFCACVITFQLASTKHDVIFPLCPLCCLAFRWLFCRSQSKWNRTSREVTSASAIHEIPCTSCKRNDISRPYDMSSQWAHSTQIYPTTFNIRFNIIQQPTQRSP